jgi:hypothetical protein
LSSLGSGVPGVLALLERSNPILGRPGTAVSP